MTNSNHISVDLIGLGWIDIPEKLLVVKHFFLAFSRREAYINKKVPKVLKVPNVPKVKEFYEFVSLES